MEATNMKQERVFDVDLLSKYEHVYSCAGSLVRQIIVAMAQSIKLE
jgi:hypothetical protein